MVHEENAPFNSSHAEGLAKAQWLHLLMDGLRQPKVRKVMYSGRIEDDIISLIPSINVLMFHLPSSLNAATYPSPN